MVNLMQFDLQISDDIYLYTIHNKLTPKHDVSVVCITLKIYLYRFHRL